MILKELKIYTFIGEATNCYVIFDEESKEIMCIDPAGDVDKIENLIWKIAYNIWCTRAKQYIKERNNTTFEEAYQTSYEVSLIDKIIYKEIVNNLDNIGLTEKEATIFKMYYLNDLSIKEISKNTETSESNIKYYLYNARKKIKERYNE